ncbi:MAG: KH domain-containing protein [Verrucomicrobia bacterium]|nr:KH domain-containing protein [Verrucomicrobiota bacterium]
MDTPEALREFLMYVVANLIDHPAQASIAIGTNTNGAISYRLQLAPEDVKRVVGKNGFTISAIRSLMNVAARKHDVKISLRVDGVNEEDISDKPHASETDTVPQPE